MIEVADCGRLFRMRQSSCDACGRKLRCVWRTPEEGFLLGRTCYRRMMAALG